MVEQRTGAPLLHERDGAFGGILFRVDRERLLQQRLEFSPVLRCDADAHRERDVRTRRRAFFEFDGPLEMLTRAFGGSAERLWHALERDEHLVQRPLAPG